jgi:6-phosphogluconolactonase
MAREYYFENADAAIGAMIADMARFIRRHNAHAGGTVFAVGGGNTPKRVLPGLAKLDCNWHQVTVSLTDDRYVSVDDPQSNEGLVRDYLLRDRAAAAAMHGLVDAADVAPPQPDIVYLGFGEDGHVASLFPSGPELDADGAGVVAAIAPVPPYKRLSLTLPVLCAAKHIVMLVSGPAKHQVYQCAKNQAEARELPLAKILHQTATSISVYIVDA